MKQSSWIDESQTNETHRRLQQIKDYSEIQSGGQIGDEELYSHMTKDTLLQNKFDTSINLLSVNILTEKELSIK